MSANRRWIALHPGDDADKLITKHPKAFRLLYQIASRARWKDDAGDGLKMGQALIGDYREAGLKTEGEYRHAKATLTTTGQATFEGTNKGTVATLLPQGIFSVTTPNNNDQNNGLSETKTTTNHNYTQRTQRRGKSPEGISRNLSANDVGI